MIASRMVATGLILSLLTPAGHVQAAPYKTMTGKTMPKATKMNVNEEAVAAVLVKYQNALNASDVDGAMNLYVSDAVNMTPYQQPVVGIEALRKAYAGGFQVIAFDIKFQIIEVVEMAPDWAFARTSSAGTTTNRATGRKTIEANQELFILKKVTDGAWKIARYSFSSTNPPNAK